MSAWRRLWLRQGLPRPLQRRSTPSRQESSRSWRSRLPRKLEATLVRNEVRLKEQLLVRRQVELQERGSAVRLVRRPGRRLLERREHRLELLPELRLERTLG